MVAKPVPEGYHTVTPYLVMRGAERTIEFLKNAFGAEVTFEPLRRPDGTILHTEVTIGDSKVMIAEASEQHPPMSTMLYVHVPDIDAVYQRAMAAGGTSLMEPMDQFYGDRTGSVKDPSGNQWEIATHIEDVPPQELQKRADTMFKQGKAA